MTLPHQITVTVDTFLFSFGEESFYFHLVRSLFDGNMGCPALAVFYEVLCKVK